MTKADVLPEAPLGTVRGGVADIRAGLAQWHVWWGLSWQAIRAQYRRTYLGPWWITLQTVIFIAGLSFLFGILLGRSMETFVPYVAMGFILFTWMTGMISSGANAFVGNSAALHTTPGPLSVYVLRGFATSTIQFLHDLIVIVAVIIVFQVQLTWSLVLFPLGLVLIIVNGIAVGLWLGPVVARYRDVGQLVGSVVRVLFFVTPIFWVADELSAGQRAVLAGWNPLAYLLDISRSPLLGLTPTTISMIGAGVVTVVNVTVGIVHFSRVRERLAYWV
jgi:ABC-type polysaccharide/polyol phosphate export permease